MRVWQVWNEPHLNLWWNTDGRSPNAWPREYAALLKTAKAAIDAADPGATVVLAALADYAWKHLTRLNNFKIGRYYDVAAINLFTARPASVFRGVRYFRRAMRRGGAGRGREVLERRGQALVVETLRCDRDHERAQVADVWDGVEYDE